MPTVEGMERCHNCGQPLIEIDNHGERLNGCLTCNLWTAGDATGWTRLDAALGGRFARVASITTWRT